MAADLQDRPETPADKAEREFWRAFDYDAQTDRWMLAEGVAPLDVLEVAVAKSRANAAQVEALKSG